MNDVLIAVSKRIDGTMLDRTRDDRHDLEVVAHREQFCAQNGVRYDQCVYQIIWYDNNAAFDTIHEVHAPNIDGIAADVLYTEKPNLGLFLPVADCIPTVIYDSKRKALALAHLGRHASTAKTMLKTIDFFIKRGSKPVDITIWMGPSVAKEDYVMEYFDLVDDPDWQPFVEIKPSGIHLDLQGLNKQLAVQRGVPAENIEISSINTARNSNYFSHSQGDTQGRFAVLTMMK